MLKGLISEESEYKGVVLVPGTEVEILGAEFNNLYPTKKYTPVKYQGVKVFVPKENVKPRKD